MPKYEMSILVVPGVDRGPIFQNCPRGLENRKRHDFPLHVFFFVGKKFLILTRFFLGRSKKKSRFARLEHQQISSRYFRIFVVWKEQNTYFEFSLSSEKMDWYFPYNNYMYKRYMSTETYSLYLVLQKGRFWVFFSLNCLTKNLASKFWTHTFPSVI